jgi:hypothetical protein
VFNVYFINTLIMLRVLCASHGQPSNRPQGQENGRILSDACLLTLQYVEGYAERDQAVHQKPEGQACDHDPLCVVLEFLPRGVNEAELHHPESLETRGLWTGITYANATAAK